MRRLGTSCTIWRVRPKNIEEKQNYYAALNFAANPKLTQRALQIALTDELPDQPRNLRCPAVARDSGHPEIRRGNSRKPT